MIVCYDCNIFVNFTFELLFNDTMSIFIFNSLLANYRVTYVKLILRCNNYD